LCAALQARAESPLHSPDVEVRPFVRASLTPPPIAVSSAPTPDVAAEKTERPVAAPRPVAVEEPVVEKPVVAKKPAKQDEPVVVVEAAPEPVAKPSPESNAATAAEPVADTVNNFVENDVAVSPDVDEPPPMIEPEPIVEEAPSPNPRVAAKTKAQPPTAAVADDNDDECPPPIPDE